MVNLFSFIETLSFNSLDHFFEVFHLNKKYNYFNLFFLHLIVKTY